MFMLNTRVNEIQRPYMYAIEPVKLFESKNSAQAQKSSFDLFNQMNFKSDYNPFKPNVKNSVVAQKLDISA